MGQTRFTIELSYIKAHQVGRRRGKALLVARGVTAELRSCPVRRDGEEDGHEDDEYLHGEVQWADGRSDCRMLKVQGQNLFVSHPRERCVRLCKRSIRS